MRAPVVLGQNMIERALRDPGFYSAVPEFAPLQAQAKMAMPGTAKGGNCNGCGDKRTSVSLVSSFTGIALTLDKASAAALCAYFGGAPLLVQGIHPISRKFASVRLT